MSPITRSLLFAMANLFHPRMLWLMVWPMLLALGAWGIAAIALWGRTAVWLADHFKQWAASGVFLVRFEAGDAMLVAAHVFMLLLFIPAVAGVMMHFHQIGSQWLPFLAAGIGGAAVTMVVTAVTLRFLLRRARRDAA